MHDFESYDTELTRFLLYHIHLILILIMVSRLHRR